MKLFTENRHQVKTSLLILIATVLIVPLFLVHGQEKNKDCIYANKSNILNPDTIQNQDFRNIFWHPYFLKLSSKDMVEMKPIKIKEEFKKLGITLLEDERFAKAYSFFASSMINHKISCEQWSEIQYLVQPSPKE